MNKQVINLVANIVLEVMGQNQTTREPSVPEIADIPIVKRLARKEGALVFVLGRRESGKSVLCYRLAEILGRPTYAISPEERPPSWVKELTIEDVDVMPPPRATLIMDDILGYLSSRDYNNPMVRTVEKLIPVCRHRRKIILILSSQSSGMTDKYMLGADVLLFKPPDLLFQEVERPAVVKFYKKIMPIFEGMSERQERRHCFAISRNWQGWARINLPSRYSGDTTTALVMKK